MTTPLFISSMSSQTTPRRLNLQERLSIAADPQSYVVKVHQCFEEGRTDFPRSSTSKEVHKPTNCIQRDVSPPVSTCPPPRNDSLSVTFTSSERCQEFIREVKSQADLFLPSRVTASPKPPGGSEAIISVDGEVPAPFMTLLFPHTEQIECLDFERNVWVDIMNSPPDHSPLSHLGGFAVGLNNFGGDGLAPPNPTLFGNTHQSETFSIRLEPQPSNCFSFPKLTSFKLSTTSTQEFPASLLLDFLEASPALKNVCLEIAAVISLVGITPGRVVELPQATEFTLTASDGEWADEIVACLSCPRLESASLTYKKSIDDATTTKIFPALVLRGAGVRLYWKNEVEEVILQVETSPTILCTIIFLSSGGVNAFELNFQASTSDEDSVRPPSEELVGNLLTQATNTILDHPHMGGIKRLAICHGVSEASPTQVSNIVDNAKLLFPSLGPLDELMIYSCDPKPYFHTELLLPQITKLIIHEQKNCSDEQLIEALKGFAKSQHCNNRCLKCVEIDVSAESLGDDGLKGCYCSGECNQREAL